MMSGDSSRMFSNIAIVLIVWFVWNVFMFLIQPTMVYFPVYHLDSTPKQWGLEYEDVAINTPDGQLLHGWYIPKAGAKTTLLFFHGNAGNISHRRASIEIFLELDLNVFIFDYRGYGKSKGWPGEQATYDDARAAWDYLINTRNVAPENIVLFGRSLGGSIATHLATRVKPAALIAESVFSSARDMASTVLPLLHYVTLLRFDYNTEAKIKKVDCPLLIVHSEEDDIIPYRLGFKVYQAANKPKSLLRLRGGHNDGFYVSGSTYTDGLKSFLDAHNIR